MMFKRSIMFFISMFLATFLVGCEEVGKADFGNLSNGGSRVGGESSDINFSGIDSIDQVTDVGARINWTNHSDATAYEIYEVTSGTSFVETVMAPATSYDLSELDPATTYKYRVRAKDSEGNLDSNTNDMSFTTNLAPNPPSGLALQKPTTSPNFDDTPTIRVSGVKDGDTIKLFTDSSCSTQVGSGTAFGDTVDVTTSSLASQAYTFYANATNSESNASSCSSASVSYTVESCPTGYIGVPENTDLGVGAFCVMQYEAKDDGGDAVSTAGGAPWTSISQTDAKSKCTSLGGNYDLISNPEWMAIAYNVEAQDANWSNGTVGDGCLFRGNNGIDDACGYDATTDPGTGTGRDSKAKHVLSNGEEIWDFAGNVWEWADWSLGGGLTSAPTSCASSQTEIPQVSCGALAAADYLPENPSGQTPLTYNSDYGLGKFYGGSGEASRRGGSWLDGTNSGAFSLNLASSPSGTSIYIGFRCVYRL